MTTNPIEMTVRTSRDLADLWRSIMGPAGPGFRSVWMALLDDDGRIRPVLVPIDHVPLRPDPRMITNLAGILAQLQEQGRPVLLLSRPGSRAMTDDDRAWGRALAPLTRWPVHLYTPSGVHVFAPDDLVPTTT